MGHCYAQSGDGKPWLMVLKQRFIIAVHVYMDINIIKCM